MVSAAMDGGVLILLLRLFIRASWFTPGTGPAAEEGRAAPPGGRERLYRRMRALAEKVARLDNHMGARPVKCPANLGSSSAARKLVARFECVGPLAQREVGHFSCVHALLGHPPILYG